MHKIAEPLMLEKGRPVMVTGLQNGLVNLDLFASDGFAGAI